MRRTDLVFVASLVALVAAGAYRAFSAAPASRRATGDAFAVHSTLAPRFHAARAADVAAPGRLRFEVAAGERVRGVAGAVVCPLSGETPLFHRGENVTAQQLPDGSLDLAAWVRARNPTEEHALHYAVWIDTSAGEEWRTGWARFDPVDLSLRGIDVVAGRGEVLDLEVVTEKGTPVPGALLSIDAGRATPGSYFQYASSGAEGRLRVSGLAPGSTWTVALPAGAGPRTRAVVAPVQVPREPVRLVVPVRGDWKFVRCEAHLPFPGAALHLDTIEHLESRAPGLWAVSPWVGPGRGRPAPLYLMAPADHELPDRVGLHFRTFRPLYIELGGEEPIGLRFVLKRDDCKPAAQWPQREQQASR